MSPIVQIPQTLGTGVSMTSGAGSPEGIVTAAVSSLYIQTGGSSAALWVKGSGSGTTGWTKLGFLPHADTNYNNGDASPGGLFTFYSQLMAVGPLGGTGADTQILAMRHTAGGADYDIHLVPQTVGGVRGTGVVFIDTDIKVADFIQSPFRGHGLRITQSDNSSFIEFPISGGVGLLAGKLKGANGGNLDLVLRIGGTSGSFVVENNTGTSVLALTNAGSLNAKRTVDTVQSLASSTTPALDAALGNYFRCSIATNIAVVVQVPTNKPAGGESQELTIEFINSSGGALSTAPTFATGTDGFLVSTVTNPANGTSIFYKFRWSSPRSRWVEVGTHLAAGI